MRKLTKGLVAGAAVAAGIGLTATPAMAAGTWTVTGAPSDGYVYADSTNTTLTIPATGAVLQCELSEVDATITNVTGHPGPAIGSIDQTYWTTCTGPFGLVFTVTHTGTWDLNAVAPTANPDVNAGSITNIKASISGSNCSADFEGGVPGTYDNTNGVLSVDPNAPNPNNEELRAKNVSGCFGLIPENALAEFDGDYQTDPATIDITHTP